MSESPWEIPMSQCQYIMRFPMVARLLGFIGGSWIHHRNTGNTQKAIEHMYESRGGRLQLNAKSSYQVAIHAKKDASKTKNGRC